MQNLQTEQRNFFKKISTLAFVNPFSEQRELADCQLLNIMPGSLDLNKRNEKIQSLLLEQLQKLQPLDNFQITNYQDKNREMLKFAWLFYQFHEFQNQFNQFINAQSQAGDIPIELPFAKAITQCFQQANFTVAETEKYIALLYQLHRGFHFINSAITGNCRSIIKLRMHLWDNIFTYNPQWYLDYLCGRMEDFSTLLLGATGTGKSRLHKLLAAQALFPLT